MLPESGRVISIAVSLALLIGICLTVSVSDNADATDGYTWEMDGTDLTVRGHGTLRYIDDWSGVTTMTVIPDGTVDFDEEAFFDCGSLTSVTVDGPVGTVGDSAFFLCVELVTFNVKGGIGTIEEYAFYQCLELKSLAIDSVGSIGSYAFTNCSGLETLTIDGPAGDIGTSAFNGCTGLTEVRISGPISSIGSSAFAYCGALTKLAVSCDNPLGIEPGSEANGMIAKNVAADGFELLHRYSATYDWSDDGKRCNVNIACANSHSHDVCINAEVTSKVKVEPTETEIGITEYSVSGTYDGFDYFDAKDVADIPATGGDGSKDMTSIGIAAAAVIVLAGMLLVIGRR